ncbi:LuxR C-terminal-related transcriptional regulator [Micromonospora sp. NPDC049559]|uniref:LuxR C-terminal-related transcriptional regulator n=1 Tax=Micromonospora sp. NPDC049559 TaxID=3155923 RepID=UPI0034498F8D
MSESSRDSGPVGARERLSRMSEPQRWLARVVAVAGTPCEPWFVERMVGRADVRLRDELEQLIARGILRDGADGLRPASATMRDAVLRATPPSLLAALRQQAAEVLAAAGLASLAAGQLLRVVDDGYRVDPELVTQLAGAPSVAPSLAADLLVAVLGRPDAGIDPALRRAWVLSAVDHLMLAGRSARALTVLTEEIAAARDGAEQLAVLHGRLGAWYATEHPSRALECLHRALSQRGLRPADRTWLLATAAEVAARIGHPDATTLLRRAQRAHSVGPAPENEVRLALARSAGALSRGDPRSAGRTLGSVDASARHARAQAATLRAERIVLHLAAGDFDAARTGLRLAADELGNLGAAVRPRLVALGCLLRLATGELPEAEARARLALREHPRRKLPDDVRADLLATVAEVLFRRGQPERARELLDPADAGREWPDDMPWLALRCAAAGDPDPARHPDLVPAAIAGLARSLRPLVLLPQRAPRLVRAALLAGDVSGARAVERYAATLATRTGSALWQGIERHARGLVERNPAALSEAVARLRTTGARPALADALFDLARLPRTPAGEAGAAIAESAALYGRLGATGDQERAQRWAAEPGTGGRRRRSADAHRGFAALTTREVRVAELLASGVTKRQAAASLFVSFHTVDTHLRGVYAKLGIRSRAQLARLWAVREEQTRAA